MRLPTKSWQYCRLFPDADNFSARSVWRARTPRREVNEIYSRSKVHKEIIWNDAFVVTAGNNSPLVAIFWHASVRRPLPPHVATNDPSTDDPQPNRSGDMTMFAKTKIALAAAMVLSTAVAASAETKPQASQAAGLLVYNMIPGYSNRGSVVVIPDPDHRGQPQVAGNENPLHH
jgi:hypothetical protein